MVCLKSLHSDFLFALKSKFSISFLLTPPTIFAETNPALEFDRQAAHGMRLDIAAGTAVRFEPGQSREIALVQLLGRRQVFGFNQLVMGAL